jgi:hypothetical protein
MSESKTDIDITESSEVSDPKNGSSGPFTSGDGSKDQDEPAKNAEPSLSENEEELDSVEDDTPESRKALRFAIIESNRKIIYSILDLLFKPSRYLETYY